MGHILLAGWIAAGAVAACITLPGSVEFLLLSVAAVWPDGRASFAKSSARWRVAVVVPAHDEETGIAACLASLGVAERGEFEVEVWVVADNCSDRTAQIAAEAGARVLERTDPLQRGKGFALDYAFAHLAPLGYEATLVVDADSTVAPNFIVAAAGALRDGAAAVQARYLPSNPDDTVRTRLMDFAQRAFNVVRPLGRRRLGVSVGILGNGFGLRMETLAAVPYLTQSVVEDVEYHLALVRSGRRVMFVDESTVLGQMPVNRAGVTSQRARWEGGRLRVLLSHGPALLGDVLRGSIGAVEPLLDLATLPLAFHVVLLLVAAATPVLWVRMLGLAGIAVVLVHLAVTIGLGSSARRDLVTLASAPAYVLWKLLLIPRLLRSARAKQAWVRTSRDPK